jgi:hypothetical protein
MKKYKSKWGLIGITKKQLKSIYQKNRIKAYCVLKERYKKEYSFILTNLMFKEYKLYSSGYELLPFAKQIRIREELKTMKGLKGGLK